jgi:hypothetical protein
VDRAAPSDDAVGETGQDLPFTKSDGSATKTDTGIVEQRRGAVRRRRSRIAIAAPGIAPDSRRSAPTSIPFSIGQNVRHEQFGDGVVIDFEGRGLDARVQVRFAREGTKWLALQYAKLTAA